jgi:hypothetical protein
LLQFSLRSRVTYSASAITVTGFLPKRLPARRLNWTLKVFPLGFGPSGLVPVLTGATLEYDGAVIVQSIGNGQGAIPFPTGNGKYLSVTAGGFATFSFTDDQSSFGFQWGSIDEFNVISFYLTESFKTPLRDCKSFKILCLRSVIKG